MRDFGRVVFLWGATLLAVGLLFYGQRPQSAPAAGAAAATAAPRPEDRRALDPVTGRFGEGVRRGPIRDGARLLAPAERAAVVQELIRVAEATGVQFAVVTFAELAEGTLAEASLAVAEKLQLGQRGKDDGLLLAVAPSAREARLEVGYGLEHVLPDVTCARLLRQNFARAGGAGVTGRDVLAAVVAVRQRLEAAVAKGELAPPAARPNAPRDPLAQFWPLLVVLALVLFTLGGRGGGPRGGRRAGGIPLWPLLFTQGSGRGFGGGDGSSTQGGGGGFGGGGASTKW